jgi:antirestriction protein ArdC
MSDTIHRMVTERMIAALERGTVPWHKPWQAAAGRPTSMTTGQPYRGVNVFLLGLTAAEEGYGSRYWGTYRQIAQLGGQVRRGEHSTLVVFWKPIEVADRDPQTGDVTVKQVPLLRYYRVFNAAQAHRLPDQFHPAPEQDTQIAEPHAALDGYLARGPALRDGAGNRAAYHPATDTIRLPLRSQFRSAEHYYATAFHEAAHSTGHPSRLNRPGIAAFDHFGSNRYAREELVAEMSSSILCAETGIDDSELFDNFAAYIAGWLSTLNHDRTLVVAAAAQAQRACDLINQAQHQAIRDANHHREVAMVAGPHDAYDRGTSHMTSWAIEDRDGPAGPTGRPGDRDAEAS